MVDRGRDNFVGVLHREHAKWALVEPQSATDPRRRRRHVRSQRTRRPLAILGGVVSVGDDRRDGLHALGQHVVVESAADNRHGRVRVERDRRARCATTATDDDRAACLLRGGPLRQRVHAASYTPLTVRKSVFAHVCGTVAVMDLSGPPADVPAVSSRPAGEPLAATMRPE